MKYLEKVLGGSKLSFNAQVVFVFLAGAQALTGKLPPMEKIPDITDESTEDVFVELSSKGYILGTPEKYKLNREKLPKESLESPTIGAKKPPAIIDLLKHFNELHRRFRKKKARSSERSLLQLRNLCRKYDGNAVKAVMEPFFRDSRTAITKQPLSTDDFFNWARRHLDKRSKSTNV